MAKKVFTTGEVARLLGININTVIKWFDTGRLNGFKLPTSNERRIPIASLRAFMSKNGIPMDLLEDNGPMRRMFQRVSCKDPVNVSVSNGRDHGNYTASLNDISQGGANVVLAGVPNFAIPVGDYSLNIEVTGGTLNGEQWQGKIAHLRPSDHTLALGVRFENITPEQNKRIATFIEQTL
ncbi:MAG TPA: PilZ domain-containing protein [bacterium]|nr:PilZ domain-containing protein [bacterium]